MSVFKRDWAGHGGVMRERPWRRVIRAVVVTPVRVCGDCAPAWVLHGCSDVPDLGRIFLGLADLGRRVTRLHVSRSVVMRLTWWYWAGPYWTRLQ